MTYYLNSYDRRMGNEQYKDFHAYIYIYMYELELLLNIHKKDILAISFQSDEANTDRPLKEYLKQLIEKSCKCLSNSIDKLYIQDLEYLVTDEIRKIYIEKILIPDEISDEIKSILSERKDAVYTNPDICLQLNDNGKVIYETIELKFTKNDSIPGSSVQQISAEEWIIFIKHSDNSIEITTGVYFHAINAKMQFPDRSPRPQVSFKELAEWN